MNSGTNIVADVVLINGQMVIRPRPGHALSAPQFAEFKRQADGTILVVPPKPWISVKKAAHILDVSESTIARFQDLWGPDNKPVLDFHRPSPGKVVVSISSVRDLPNRVQEHPEFWARCKVSRPHIAKRVAKALQNENNLLLAI
jgi:hypothetical protein